LDEMLFTVERIARAAVNEGSFTALQPNIIRHASRPMKILTGAIGNQTHAEIRPGYVHCDGAKSSAGI
jgi:hypothetical protein